MSSPQRIINNEALICPNAPRKVIIKNYYNNEDKYIKNYSHKIFNIINYRRLSTDEIQPTINEEVEPPAKKICA